MAAFRNIRDVTDWRLCLGCGACAYICPEKKISIIDVVDEGNRPLIEDQNCGSCRICLDVCPAIQNDHTEINTRFGLIKELKPAFGPVLEVWEGYAADPKIRYAGSSGGVITAISLYCLEAEMMHGVLHIGQDRENPIRNKTTLSRTRADLFANAGSRYAPASACDSLHLIEQAPAPCVFVGQPSEVSALRKAQGLRPTLAKNVGLAISFFCAGSPATRGTAELLKSKGILIESVKSFRYRGNGWPGMFAVEIEGQTEVEELMTYKESWGFVQAYRPFSTHLCPDGTGEDADISCGDPWYREVEPDESGSSLVLVRTEKGRKIIQDAIAAGYLDLQPAEAWKLLKSQANLFAKRGAIWGRVNTLKLFGIPAPKLVGFSLFRNWLRLSLEDKLRSTVGTARRILAWDYRRPRRADQQQPAVQGQPKREVD